MFHHCLKSKFSKSSSWLLARVLIIYLCLYFAHRDWSYGMMTAHGLFLLERPPLNQKVVCYPPWWHMRSPESKNGFILSRLPSFSFNSSVATNSTLRRLVRKKTIIILRAVAKFSRQLIFLNDNMQIAVGVRNYNRIVDICRTNYYCGNYFRLFILQ